MTVFKRMSVVNANGVATMKVLLCIIVLFIIYAFIAGSETNEQKANRVCNDAVSGYYASQDIIKRRLKAPSTATFPGPYEKSISIVQVSSCRFRIAAWVDSQNSFGAMLRSRYGMNIEYRPRSDDWHATDIYISN